MNSVPNTLWPEALRDHTQPGPRFPITSVLAWLFVPLLAAVVLLGCFAFLEQRAARQVAYISSGRLNVMRVDGSGMRAITFRDAPGAAFAGTPQWSPDGKTLLVKRGSSGRFAIASLDGTTLKNLPSSASSISESSEAVWSPSSNYMLVVRPASTDQQPQAFAFVDLRQESVVTSETSLILNGWFNWHPRNDELLVTTPNLLGQAQLQVLTPNGVATPFAPDDKQLARWSGAWSPTGDRIAYVASGLTLTNDTSIWIANRDGSAPQQLVNDGQNNKPVWSANGEYIFFTRTVTSDTSNVTSYELQRVRADGQELAYIGTSVSPFYQFGPQNTLISWSPNNKYMFYQGANDQGNQAVFVAAADGKSSRIVTNVSEAARIGWSPTSRALVVADNGTTKLYWFDPELSDETLVSSGSAELQP